MDLFLREATERIGADEALAKIDALMDWLSFYPFSSVVLGAPVWGHKVMTH